MGLYDAVKFLISGNDRPSLPDDGSLDGIPSIVPEDIPEDLFRDAAMDIASYSKSSKENTIDPARWDSLPEAARKALEEQGFSRAKDPAYAIKASDWDALPQQAQEALDKKGFYRE